jgi:tetratricopeptide (TPR) repeat protein
MKGTFLLVALFTVFVTAAPTGASGPEASALLAGAHAAWGRGDLTEALRLLNEAVRADQGSVEIRSRRAIFLQSYLGAITDEKRRQEAFEVARADLQFIIRTKPNGPLSPAARDALVTLEGRDVFPARAVACPPEAMKDRAEAYQLFMARRPREAAEMYRKASDGCPESSDLAARYGDTLLSLGQLTEARAALQEAIRRDRWNLSAHRYLVDVEARLGNRAAAYDASLLAIVADPTSEIAWAALRRLLPADAPMNRVVNHRPAVILGAEGKANILLPFDIDKAGVDFSFWLALGMAEAAELQQRSTSAASPLERDRKRVEMATKFARHVAAKEGKAVSPMAALMEQAEGDGFWAEAIFIHLLDRRTLAEYVDYRATRAERLVEYVKRYVAPLPAAAR